MSTTLPTPPKPPTTPLDSVNTLINDSWQFFSKHARNLIGITGVVVGAQFILLLIVIALGLIGADGRATAESLSLTGAVVALSVAVVFGLAVAVVSLWSTVSLYTYVIANNPALGVWAAFRQSGPKVRPYFWVSLIVGLITFGGFLLLIIPGIYWGVLYGLAPLIVLAEGKEARALTRSKFLIRGQWWAVFWRNFVFGLLTVGVAVAISFFFSALFGILGRMYEPVSILGDFGQYFATLVTTPLSAVFTYHVYRSLKRVKGEGPAVSL